MGDLDRAQVGEESGEIGKSLHDTLRSLDICTSWAINFKNVYQGVT